MGKPLSLDSFTALDLDGMVFPYRKPIVEPWLRSGETAIIWAASGVGKTFLCLSIALAVAGGGEVGEWKAPEPRKVLYIDAEMNGDDMQERIRFLLDSEAVQVPDRETALGNLRLICNQQQRPGTEFLDLTNLDHHGELLKLARGYDLVVLDNLTTMSAGMTDENAAAEFKTVQPLFMALKQAGIATVLVHHSNKSGSAMRGSTALEATFEVILGLKRPAICKAGSAAFEATFSKFRARGNETLAPKTWRLGEAGWTINEVEPENAKDDPVVLAIRSMNFTSQKEVAEALGLSQGEVSKRITKLYAIKALTRAEVTEAFETARSIKSEDPEAF